jgi:preprotein translocase subunit SecE
MLGVQVPPGLPFIYFYEYIFISGFGVMDKLKQLFEKIIRFLKEAKVELKKVTWPSPKQTLASTSVVIIVVIVVSAFLGIVDFGLAKVIRLVLG